MRCWDLSFFLLGLVVFLAVSWMITANQAGDRPPDVIAYFWAFGLGALLLVRRTYPLIVLWVTVITLVAYYMAGYPAVGLGIPTAAALLRDRKSTRLNSSHVAISYPHSRLK